ncbi:ferric reductase-like transmembrane domain-containing protein [Stenotrophomonas sp. S48]|uniref:ferric reductase-like transmembrane domain-containing protein n=1 Tax=unclassified Stenotrophomonas TaxID=196198 RepID=UPI0019007567|nr:MULTISPECIES: ferric reductase-like transmembrane domain-containing protein [unclassified Stenotrophomonas]MBK0024837.1 ferric reductase-like transmembrane domain-containing protein [Stenotrophomonas sp. S48]MBK0047756.1 ferric reductase-like transmembrane domain-containing protein [Stenotrophomonas sp. S49]
MAASTPSSLHGWRLFVAIAVVLIAFAMAAFALQPDVVEGSRAAIRVTARTSFVLFLAAFTASSFASLLPGPTTHFLLRERRIIGLSFAFSHLLHAVAITTFGMLNPAFWPARSALANLPGTVGYVAILALAITSHRGIARRMGPTAWRRLHTTGMWIIAAVFTYSYFKRVPVNFWYAVPSALLFTAFVVRAIAKHAQSLKRSVHARPLRAG